VALGAAGQCAIMCGDLEEVILLDVTPHSLGVKVRDDRMSVLIPRNSTVPTSKTKIYRTTTDDQQWVEIEVYQGEANLVADNAHVGRFRLGDLPRGPAGQVHIEVTFLIDVDGVINASAREMRTGKQTSVQLTAASGLTDAQFERVATEHRAEMGRGGVQPG
jgi:molecular chaperone DnaK